MVRKKIAPLRKVFSKETVLDRLDGLLLALSSSKHSPMKGLVSENGVSSHSEPLVSHALPLLTILTLYMSTTTAQYQPKSSSTKLNELFTCGRIS
jgi:hypothetical protein